MSCCNTSPCACVNLGDSEQAPVIYTTTPLTYVENIAALKALRVTGRVTGFPVEVLGYRTPGDDGGGIFIYDETSVATVNLGTIFAPDSGTGRWIRSYDKVMNLKQWGAYGDGLTDDSVYLSQAVDWWVGNDNVGRTIEVTTGEYRIATPVRKIVNGPAAGLGTFNGLGGRFLTAISPVTGVGTVAIVNNVVNGTGTSFISQLSPGHQIVIGTNAYTITVVTDNVTAKVAQDNSSVVSVAPGSSFVIWAPMLSFYSNTNARRPNFRGLQFRGSSSVTAGAMLQFVGQNGFLQNWDGINVDSCLFMDSYGTALEMVVGIFETNINNIEAYGPDGGNRDVVRILGGDNPGDVSSINIYAPNIRGGLHGLIGRGSDIFIYGGTAILAKNEGVALYDYSGGVFGLHVENNYYGVAAADGYSGLYVLSYRNCVISGIYGTRSAGLSGQKHVVRFYISSGANIVASGIQQSSGIVGDNGGYVEGTTAGNLVAIGCSTFTEVYANGTVTLVRGSSVRANMLSRRSQFIAYAASVTPNLTIGTYIDIGSITGAFTIENPTGITAIAGDTIVIQLRPETTGGYLVSFGSSFATVSALSTTINKYTTIEFMYSPDSKWREVFRSTTS